MTMIHGTIWLRDLVCVHSFVNSLTYSHATNLPFQNGKTKLLPQILCPLSHPLKPALTPRSCNGWVHSDVTTLEPVDSTSVCFSLLELYLINKNGSQKKCPCYLRVKAVNTPREGEGGQFPRLLVLRETTLKSFLHASSHFPRLIQIQVLTATIGSVMYSLLLVLFTHFTLFCHPFFLIQCQVNDLHAILWS